MDFWEDYEVLTVETPEHLELRLPLAGFGPRFLAFAIDSLISGFVAGILALILIAAVMGLGTAAPGGTAALVLLILAFLLILLSPVIYFAVFESLWRGQTPGKRATGIRVVMRGGVPLTFRAVVLRNLLRIVDYLPSYCFAGLVSFFATSYQQRLGDLVADTVVVKEFNAKLPFQWVGGTAATGRATAGSIPPLLSYVIGNFLSRRLQLSQVARERVSRLCIERLGYSAAGMTLEQREDYLTSVMQHIWSGAH